MTHFYFNFRQGASYSMDEEGCPFDSVEAAYLGAVVAAQEMWRELLIGRQDPLSCAFEVTDAAGQELFTLPFSEVLEACNTRTVSPPRSHELSDAIRVREKAQQTMHDTKRAVSEARSALAETIRLLKLVDGPAKT